MGNIVDKDIDRAKELYEKAAQRGNPSGFYNLGMIHRQDKTADPVKVNHMIMDYMQKAAYLGNDRAKDFVSKFVSNLPSVTRIVTDFYQELEAGRSFRRSWTRGR